MLQLLEANEEAFTVSFPAFRALLDARSARKAQLARAGAAAAAAGAGAGAGAAGAPAGAPAAGARAAGALLKASDLIQTAKATAVEEAVRATYPEMNRDPRLFRTALLAAGSCWDSQLATARGGEGGGGGGTRLEPFVARLPDYSAAGNNTLVLRAEYFALPDERSYAAVHIGPVAPGAAPPNPVREFAQEVHMHVAFRVDPSKSGDLRQRYVQTYRSRGRWEEGANAWDRRAWRAGEWPFVPKREFWLRLTLAPEGCYSYVDGVAMAFTPHPAGGEWRPPSDPHLHVVLPVAGDTAEKPTWRVREAFWGHCAVSAQAAALAAKWRETTGALPQQRKVAIADELWVTGIPAAAEEGDLREAFAPYCAVLRVALDGRGGAAVQVGGVLEGGGGGGGGEGGEAAAAAGLLRVVADTHRRAVVLGATLNVVQAHRVVEVK